MKKLTFTILGWLISAGLIVGLAWRLDWGKTWASLAATNLWFIYKPRRGPQDWLKEHLKGLVGAGISVYTAFLAFGAVRLMPELALNPALVVLRITGYGQDGPYRDRPGFARIAHAVGGLTALGATPRRGAGGPAAHEEG